MKAAQRGTSHEACLLLSRMYVLYYSAHFRIRSHTLVLFYIVILLCYSFFAFGWCPYSIELYMTMTVRRSNWTVLSPRNAMQISCTHIIWLPVSVSNCRWIINSHHWSPSLCFPSIFVSIYLASPGVFSVARSVSRRRALCLAPLARRHVCKLCSAGFLCEYILYYAHMHVGTGYAYVCVLQLDVITYVNE